MRLCPELYKANFRLENFETKMKVKLATQVLLRPNVAAWILLVG